MKTTERKQAIREFVERWTGTGDEKQDTQVFWTDLLRNVLGVEQPEQVIKFEKPVVLQKSQTYIDGYIPSTRVLIEQKSLGVDLDAKHPQSDKVPLTPFEQAKRYDDRLPFSQKARWIVVSDFGTFRIHDMEDTLAPPVTVRLADLERDAHMLQFLVDAGNTRVKRETDVSLEAGRIVGRLYDALEKRYKGPGEAKNRHSLNVLCVRLVFCLYADSAEVFGRRGMFADYLHAHKDNLRDALLKLFQVLDQKEEERDPYEWDDLLTFPYVNGGLFRGRADIPKLTPEIVDLILQDAADEFDWRDISPTIFGSIFEDTLNPETRDEHGMHYTSISNIRKVIGPLFLDDLKAELDAASSYKSELTRRRHLKAFRDKLASLRFFDPACGSGNFLTQAYIDLRRLENRAIETETHGQIGWEGANPVQVGIGQFHGIELNDFAVSVAQTALWIAEAQLLQETERILKMDLNYLPLTTAAHITRGNALQMDWNEMIPGSECTFVMGNPPFAGARLMSPEQKRDVLDVFGKDWRNVGNLDYVTCWFKKASDYMQGTSIRTAFVATNSICQGDSVGVLWDPLFREGVHIDFAYQTFRWDSEARSMAHVHVVIVGFSDTPSAKPPILYSASGPRVVKRINGYLTDGPNICVRSRQRPLSSVPDIGIGCQLIDWGEYLFTKDDMVAFIKEEPDSETYFIPFYGGKEFINQNPKYCLDLRKCPPSQLKNMPACMERVRKVRNRREKSNRASTRRLADTPTEFLTCASIHGDYLAIPVVSSEHRRYIPIGFMHDDVMCGQKLMLMPKASLYHFGILTSNVHMAWMRTVAGRLKSDYSYSKDIVYNNFPWPDPTPEQKVEIERTARKILDARALYPDESFAGLYGEDMYLYQELVSAHEENDRAVMAAYGLKYAKPRNDDDWDTLDAACVARLMEMYEDLVDSGR